MRIKHAFILAKTKFRIRRVRLFIGIITSGLLFGLTAALISMMFNLKNGIKPYLDYGINNKYLVEARNMQFSIMSNNDLLMKRALEIYEQNKKNGLYSDEEIIFEYPIEKYTDGTSDIKMGTKASTAAIIEVAMTQNNYNLEDAEKLSEQAGAKDLNHYSATLHPSNGGALTSISTDGEEELKTIINSNLNDIILSRFSNPVLAIKDSLYSLYLDAGVNVDDSEIPVIIDETLWRKVGQKTIQFCYRDAKAVAYIRAALKGEENIVLPSETCMHPNNIEGYAKLITFRVVGVFPNRVFSDTHSNISDLIRSIASSGLPEGVIIPFERITDKQKELVKEFFTAEKDLNSYMYNKDSFIFEFNTANQAKEFLDNYNCDSVICQIDKPFILTESSNSAILVSDIFDKTKIIISFVLIVVTFLCAIILMTTIGRILSDSRTENAIFTAIGYTKGNILQIYLVYTLIYSFSVGVLTGIIGIAIPFLAQLIAGDKISSVMNGLFHTPSTYSMDIGSPTIFVPIVIAGIILVSTICATLVIVLKANHDTIKELRRIN